LERLYEAAFPDEDLLPVVRRLLEEPDGVLSLVAVSGGRIVGHVIYTKCTVEPSGHTVALLGPLCAAPDLQKQSIGSRLVRTGLERLANWQASEALVLGDPNYYSRFGFLPGCRIDPPYALPEEWADAWQSLNLLANAAPDAGLLKVPAPWQDRALWSD